MFPLPPILGEESQCWEWKINASESGQMHAQHIAICGQVTKKKNMHCVSAQMYLRATVQDVYAVYKMCVISQNSRRKAIAEDVSFLGPSSCNCRFKIYACSSKCGYLTVGDTVCTCIRFCIQRDMFPLPPVLGEESQCWGWKLMRQSPVKCMYSTLQSTGRSLKEKKCTVSRPKCICGQLSKMEFQD